MGQPSQPAESGNLKRNNLEIERAISELHKKKGEMTKIQNFFKRFFFFGCYLLSFVSKKKVLEINVEKEFNETNYYS